jgi:hypothetical protein
MKLAHIHRNIVAEANWVKTKFFEYSVRRPALPHLGH